MSANVNIPVTLNIPLVQITMLARFSESLDAKTAHDIAAEHIRELAEEGLVRPLSNGAYALTQLGDAALEAVVAKHPTEIRVA
jgi:Mn-dependent DtxR family transcriptional regulator